MKGSLQESYVDLLRGLPTVPGVGSEKTGGGLAPGLRICCCCSNCNAVELAS